jgi:LuxR family maltose regulon positive regulatory protein
MSSTRTLRSASAVTPPDRTTPPVTGHSSVDAGLSVPAERNDGVPRARLVNRLRVARDARLVLVTAPAGYGKTTLVADWARRDGRPFAWHAVSVEERGDALVENLAFAVAQLLPAHAPMLADLTSRRGGHDRVALLADVLEASHTPVVLVLDDAERLDAAATDVLMRLVAELPAESQLVLVSRSASLLPIARLRAQGDLIEIGVDQLRFSDREAASLLARAGVDIRHFDHSTLNAQLEGWPAGLKIAALSLRTPRPRAADQIPGDSMIADYLRSEALASLAADELQLLTRCSVLDRLCGSLCDAVAETDGSAMMLDTLERRGMYVVALDRERSWFRIHEVFRDLLERELERREPDAPARLRGLAAGWCAAHGQSEQALEYARRADDPERLIDLIGELLLPFSAGRDPAKIARLLAPLDDDTLLETHPRVAAVGALAWSMAGRAEEAERWAAIAERSAGASSAAQIAFAKEPCVALLRSLMHPHDAHEMAEHAASAVTTLPFDSPWRGPALLALGVARALEQDGSHAETALGEAAGAAASTRSAPVEAAALGLQSLVAAQRGAWRRSDTLAGAAVKIVVDADLDGDVASLFAHTASARASLRHGDWVAVKGSLDAAQVLLPRLTYASGSMSVLLRTELAAIHLALGDTGNAERLLDEAGEVFDRNPKLVVLRPETTALRAQITTSAKRVSRRASTLTAAELRLLPLLTTHLSFREIADRLFVSRNTVKTQAISVYRKLGVSSRGEAVAHASEMGLVTGDHREGR